MYNTITIILIIKRDIRRLFMNDLIYIKQNVRRTLINLHNVYYIHYSIFATIYGMLYLLANQP